MKFEAHVSKKQEYRVEAYEKFLVHTTYFVEAESEEEAERLCRSGEVAYEDSEVQDGDDEWIETVEVVLRDKAGLFGGDDE